MSAGAPKLDRPATLEDLYAIPEDERRHELIEGVVEEKGAGTGEHGSAHRKLSAYVDPFDQRPGGRWPGGWWFAIDTDVYFDARNTFLPDIAGWRRERVPERPRGVPIMIRPDWVCEILSTNKRNDLIKKKRVYHRHQVGHYWILDPERELLSVYRWAQEAYMEILVAARGDRVRAEPFDAIELQVGVLFGDDLEE